jgi:hypothetical protein
MREKVSYDNYYDRGMESYDSGKIVGPVGVFMISFVACGVGYYFGYKKARTTAKTVLDKVLEKCPDHKETIKKVWNTAVDEYFDGK